MAYEAIFNPQNDRRITIRNPKLRKIRNEFRKLLVKVVKVKIIELLELRNQKRKLWVEGIISEINYFEIMRPIQKKEVNLRNALFRSIVVCHTCGDLEKDRIFRMKDATWYCPRCYKILEKSDRKEFEALTRLD